MCLHLYIYVCNVTVYVCCASVRKYALARASMCAQACVCRCVYACIGVSAYARTSTININFYLTSYKISI